MLLGLYFFQHIFIQIILFYDTSILITSEGYFKGLPSVDVASRLFSALTPIKELAINVLCTWVVRSGAGKMPENGPLKILWLISYYSMLNMLRHASRVSTQESIHGYLGLASMVYVVDRDFHSEGRRTKGAFYLAPIAYAVVHSYKATLPVMAYSAILYFSYSYLVRSKAITEEFDAQHGTDIVLYSMFPVYIGILLFKTENIWEGISENWGKDKYITIIATVSWLIRALWNFFSLDIRYAAMSSLLIHRSHFVLEWILGLQIKPPFEGVFDGLTMLLVHIFDHATKQPIYAIYSGENDILG
jgi:hypothetical protein